MLPRNQLVRIVAILPVVVFGVLIAISESNGGQAKFEDVSTVEPYSQVTGLKYVSKALLTLHAWRRTDGSSAGADSYYLIPPPGTQNRFVSSRVKVPPGLEMEILAVEKCANCFSFFRPRVRLRVGLKNLTTRYPSPVYLPDIYLVEDWGRGDEPLIYSSDFF